MTPVPAARRRAVLRTSTVLLAGALAGCSGGGGVETFDGWLEDVDNYDGVVDRTGRDEVRVAVGAPGNGGNFAFDPPAVRVDAGTTVVWEWTGEGGAHNVVATDDSVGSGTSSEKGFTFEHAFESAGTTTYACVPHRDLGMKGVVVAE